MQRVQQFLASNPDASPQAVLDELRMQSTLSALPVEDRMFLFVRAAFGPEAAKANLVSRHKAVLQGLILQVDEAAYQRRLIGVMEHHCAVAFPEQAKWFPLLLKQLYDEDLVDEDVFLEWYEEEEGGEGDEFARREVTPAMAKALREGAGKFIQWLEQASSDEEEEEDSEAEEED